MSSELAKESWQLSSLADDALGPYGAFPRLTNPAKQAVWDEYHARRTSRVPVTLGTNNRVFLLDGRFDADGLRYKQVFNDPALMLVTQLRWQYVLRMRHHVLCDHPTGLPEVWEVSPDFHNICEAAFFGAEIHYAASEVPDTRPFLSDDCKRAIFDVDIDHPLQHGFFEEKLAMWEAMSRLAAGKTFLGRPIRITPYATLGTDGPLTVAMNLRGAAILRDLKRDPDYAHQLFEFITVAALRRREAFRKHWGMPAPQEAWLADDSIALLGPAQYQEHVLPYHRQWYDTVDPDRTRTRCMHLCGDATRHFGTLRELCGVSAFDTGFPVDFAGLRAELGPDVEILGGVEVATLLHGRPAAVYRRARAILESGVLVGSRFVLREANNLPPGVPWANLAAMYKAALDCDVSAAG